MALRVVYNTLGSNQFKAWKESKQFTQRELMIMAHLFTKITPLEAICNIVAYADYPRLPALLHYDIRHIGSMNIMQRTTNQWAEEKLHNQRNRNHALESACYNHLAHSPSNPSNCTDPKHYSDGVCMSCMKQAKKIANKESGYVPTPDLGTYLTEKHNMDFHDLFNMMARLRRCRCCVRHQCNHPYFLSHEYTENIYDHKPFLRREFLEQDPEITIMEIEPDADIIKYRSDKVQYKYMESGVSDLRYRYHKHCKCPCRSLLRNLHRELFFKTESDTFLYNPMRTIV